MKKIAFMLMLIFAAATVTFAQQGSQKDTKVKKTANVGEKVHNVFSKRKHYNGYKVKKTHEVNGRQVKTKTKVHTQ